MIKLTWISDKNNNGITYWLFKKIAAIRRYDVTGEAAEDILKYESTDFLFLNLKKPANTDVMDRLCLRNINRLRVSVFTFHPSEFRLLKFFLPSGSLKQSH